MVLRQIPTVPLGGDEHVADCDAATQHTHWRKRIALSSIADIFERFLGQAGMDRGPWLTVALAAGIASWFALANAAQWVFALAAGVILALGAQALWSRRDERAELRLAASAISLMFALGVALIWARSEMVGAPAFDRPMSAQFEGRVLERIEQPAQERVRLVLAIRHPDTGEAAKIRVNVPQERDLPELGEGALVSLQARLMPPAPPMLPGGYDFARAAWFAGLSATGSAQGDITVIEAGRSEEAWIARIQRRLSRHVRDQLDGSPGSIAAAFASGDRGAITRADEEAMRDAGLTHLLSISGLHVSAVIAAAYLLAIKLLALWPWLTLRVRLPVLAAGLAACSGIAYTLLTGAQVPTVRSCVAALLVLGALAIGREPLSLRMVAVAAIVVMLLWPESLVGPSFQMSFCAVIAIVALHNAQWVRDFLAPREESQIARISRRAAMLLLTGLVIELALMPIVLFHFHRAGVYGALANVVAIPLVTFVSMPLIAIALIFDIAGAGAPFWWLAGKSLDLMLWIAHFTASWPGAVKLVPQMGPLSLSLFLAGGAWLALWRGRVRALGLAPALGGAIVLWLTPVPDLLIASDGRNVGIVGEDDQLLLLRETRSDYTRENMQELAGIDADPIALANWPGAQCSRDFCTLALEREGKVWHLLMSRSREIVEERALAAACARSDIVVADRWLPRSCQPRWLKADNRMLSVSGGLAITLADRKIRTVAQNQGDHGWWRGRDDSED